MKNNKIGLWSVEDNPAIEKCDAEHVLPPQRNKKIYMIQRNYEYT